MSCCALGARLAADGLAGNHGDLAPSVLKQRCHFPRRILDREPKTPKTFRSHKTTAMITTAFKIVLMEPAIGINRLINQRITPTTIRTTMTWIKGMSNTPPLFLFSEAGKKVRFHFGIACQPYNGPTPLNFEAALRRAVLIYTTSPQDSWRYLSPAAPYPRFFLFSLRLPVWRWRSVSRFVPWFYPSPRETCLEPCLWCWNSC